MRKHLPLFVALLFTATPMLAVSGQATSSDSKPDRLNVLLIVLDDLRPDLGCYGAKHVISPNIDKLAARGLLFEHAYCQVAVCNASRSSFLGGVRPDTTGVLDNQHFLRPQLPDIVTLPQHFKNNGWHALSLGKIFHHSEREPGDDPQSWSEPSWYHGEPYQSWFTQVSNDLIKQSKRSGSKLSRGPPFEAANEPDDAYPDGKIALKAIETLQRLKTLDKPFFLGVGFLKPHLPFTCPQKYWDQYPADTIKLPANYAPPKNVPEPALHNWYELRTYGGVPATGGIPDDMALNLIRGYRACTTFVDVQVGRVLDELDRLGLRESTIVVLLGDHGYHLGENGIFTKMTNFEHGTHAPLIISLPGQKSAGQHTKAMVEFVDLYPTLAELCGLSLPKRLEGQSFVPLIKNPDGSGKPAVFSQYLRAGKEKFMGRSVRTARWRYTEWTSTKNELVGTELYDEQGDPQENVNVAGEPSNTDVMVELAKQLRSNFPTPPKTTSAKKESPAVPTAMPKTNGDLMIGDFEGATLNGWTATGDGFHSTPFRPGNSGRFVGFDGAGIEWSGRGGVQSTGTLLSPEFQIERPFINWLVAGARDLPSNLGVALLIDDKVVRAASASEAKDLSHAMYWRTWEVRDLAGKTARIRVNDHSTGGSIAVDSFAQSEMAKAVPVDASVLGHETLRPQFHFTTLTGWQNDANGLFYHEGVWHLFHQHRPPPGDRIVWGQAVSPDLLHWRRLPTAIVADDADAAASGSALVDHANASGLKRGDDPPILLFYTDMPPANGERKATQCLAVSTDGGKTYEKFNGNPLLRTPGTRDRDPKVFYHEPTKSWIMALSLSRNNTDREHATYGLFRSKDLKTWTLFQELGPGAWYWECPDMFPLAIDGDPNHVKWIFMKGSGDYIVGDFNGEKFTPETEPIRTHWGGNFYGGQTFADAPNGRRVHIAWMSTGKDGPNSWPGMPFNQQMSFPRELTLRTTPEGVRLFREPVAEVSQLHAKRLVLEPGPFGEKSNRLQDVHSDLLDMEFEIEPRNAQQLKLSLRGVDIVYEAKNQKLRVLDRSLALTPVNGKLHLRILLDQTSIEIFANHGEVTHSLVFSPSPSNHDFTLRVTGGDAFLAKGVIHELKPALPEN